MQRRVSFYLFIVFFMKYQPKGGMSELFDLKENELELDILDYLRNQINLPNTFFPPTHSIHMYMFL